MTNPELTLRELNTIAEALYSAYLVKMNEFKNENNFNHTIISWLTDTHRGNVIIKG